MWYQSIKPVRSLNFLVFFEHYEQYVQTATVILIRFRSSIVQKSSRKSIMERRRNTYFTKYFCATCKLFVLENQPPKPNSLCRNCRRKLHVYDTDGYVSRAWCKFNYLFNNSLVKLPIKWFFFFFQMSQMHIVTATSSRSLTFSSRKLDLCFHKVAIAKF